MRILQPGEITTRLLSHTCARRDDAHAADAALHRRATEMQQTARVYRAANARSCAPKQDMLNVSMLAV